MEKCHDFPHIPGSDLSYLFCFQNQQKELLLPFSGGESEKGNNLPLLKRRQLSSVPKDWLSFVPRKHLPLAPVVPGTINRGHRY